jgi:hypothetical protein
MASTVADIEVTTTWGQFPASTDFLFQNKDAHETIFVAVSVSSPGATIIGYEVLPKATVSNINTGNHWHRVDSGTASATFTDNS